MGGLDDILGEAEKLVHGHGDQVDSAVDKATDLVDDKTGDKFSSITDQVDSAVDKATDKLDS